MRELFDDIAIAGQKDADVGKRPQRSWQGGGNGTQPAHADEVVHLGRNEQYLQKNALVRDRFVAMQEKVQFPRTKTGRQAAGLGKCFPAAARDHRLRRQTRGRKGVFRNETIRKG
jgi:hypothetical protein